MRHWTHSLALIVLTAWVGALWAIGYLAAPALFYSLPDNHMQAGALAGRMFTWVAYLGMASAMYLLIQRVASVGTQALKQAVFWIVVAMLMLTLAGQFGIQPILAQLKAQALPANVMQSVFADRFAAWHGVASIAYLLQSLLGLGLVLKFR